MKKMVILLITGLFILITACGGSSGKKSDIATDSEQNEMENPDADEVDDSAKVIFKDSRLEKCVKENAGIENGDVTENVAAKIEELECVNYYLYELGGIEALVNLEKLNIGSNYITDISMLSELPKLESLDISRNLISDLKVLSEIPELTELYISNLEVISTSSPVRMREVDIDTSEVSNLKNLEVLDLTSTCVSDLDFLKPLKTLKTLKLHTCDVDNLEVLKSLDSHISLELSFIDKSDIYKIAELKNLKELRLRNRRIDDLSPLANLTQLENMEVSIANSDVSWIKNLVNLKVLKINAESELDLEPIADLKKLNKLSIFVDAEINNIEKIGMITTLTELEIMQPYGGGYATSFDWIEKLINIHTLHIFSDSLNDISSLSALKKLEKLYLKSEDLNDISPLRELVNLKQLNLEGWQVADVGKTLVNLKNLEELRVILAMEEISFIEELKKLKSLVVFGLGISDLAPISELDKLESLSVRGIEADNLQFLEKLENLSTLELFYGQLQDFSHLSNIKNLRSLVIEDLYEVDFSSIGILTNLEKLSVRDNYIKQYFFSARFPNLVDFYFGSNSRDLDGDDLAIDVSNVNEMTSLRTLWINNIKATSGIKIDKLSSLIELDLEENNIRNIESLKALKKIKLLYLNNSEISDISALENLADLRGLYLGDNSISDISALSSLENIVQINLSYNMIKDLTPLKNMTQLRSLPLYNNDISDISPLMSLKNLVDLDISNNPLSDLPPLKEMHSLKSVDIGQTEVSDLTGLSNMANLVSLNINDCNLSNISSLKNLPKLESLHLYNNNLSNISSLSSFENLKYLILDDNPISDLSQLKGLDSLLDLYLRNTNIADLSGLGDLANLQSLYLGGNNISDVTALKSLKNLKELGLDQNEISDLTPFSNLTTLEYLSLYYNNITDVTPLKNLINLKSLYLSDNCIADFSPLKELEENGCSISNYDNDLRRCIPPSHNSCGEIAHCIDNCEKSDNECGWNCFDDSVEMAQYEYQNYRDCTDECVFADDFDTCKKNLCTAELNTCKAVTPENCGNNSVDENELCDGNSIECSEIGNFYSGMASCKASCDEWDNSECAQTICSENDLSCNGEIALKCSENSWTESKNCADSGNICYNGACVEEGYEDLRLDFEGPEYEGDTLLVINSSVDGNATEFSGTVPATPVTRNLKGKSSPESLFTNFKLDNTIPLPENLTPDFEKIKKRSVISGRFEPGETDDFYVVVGDDEKELVTATLQYVGNHCEIWAVNTEIMSVERAEAVGREFDSNIYDFVTTNFYEPSDVDGNGRIKLLFTKMNPNYGGYFSPADMLYTKEEYSESNEADIIYLNHLLGNRNSLSIIAHEFQHLVHSNRNLLVEQDIDSAELEYRWIDEGFAMASEHHYNGIQERFVDVFSSPPYSNSIRDGHSLLFWEYNSTDVISNYSLSYLFFQYLRIRTERTDIYREIIEDENNSYCS